MKTMQVPVVVFALLMVTIPSTAASQTNPEDSLRVQGAQSQAGDSSRVKNPTSAVLRSLVVPGWGQYYNGKKWKAAIVFAAEIGALGTAIYWDREADRAPTDEARFIYQEYRNTAYWVLAFTIMLSMMDAYVDAQLSDFDDSPSLETSQSVGLAPGAGFFAIHLQIRL
jgi:hypothetical protein